MTCKQCIVSLLDELLRLFEPGEAHKLVYKRLILLRHKIRNVYETEAVRNACKTFYEKHSKQLSENDLSVFNETPYSDIIEMIWTELISENKAVVWEWREKIINQIKTECDLIER
jgi:hypothetical protein